MLLECVGLGLSEGWNLTSPNKPTLNQNGTFTCHPSVYFDEGVEIDTSGGVVIDEDCLICKGVGVFRHTHVWNPYSNQWDEFRATEPLHIEGHVFIGAHALILWHVNRIGEQAVIGAGSVVTKDVPARSLVAGNPAKPKS